MAQISQLPYASTTTGGESIPVQLTPSSQTQRMTVNDLVARVSTGLGPLATLPTLDLSSSYASGILAAARFPALTGDVTTISGSLSTTIGDNTVSLAKMAQTDTGTLLYRKTAGTGNWETQTLATLKTDLGLTGTNSGDQTITLTGDVSGSGTGSFATTLATVSASKGGTGQTSYTIGDLLYASASTTLSKLAGVATGNVLISGGVGAAPSWGKVALGTHVSGTLLAANFLALTGDVTNTAGTVATTISAGAVTLAKMANLAANSFIGNNTGSAATPIAMTVAQAQALLGLGTAAYVATGTSGGAIPLLNTANTWSAFQTLAYTNATFALKDTSAAVDNKIFDFYLNGSSMFLRAVNDAYGAALTLLTFARSGVSSGAITASVPMLHANGSVSAPSIAFTSANGWYFDGTHILKSIGGTRVGYQSATGYTFGSTGTAGDAYGLGVYKASGGAGIRMASGANLGDIVQSGTDLYITNNAAGLITFFTNSTQIGYWDTNKILHSAGGFKTENAAGAASLDTGTQSGTYASAATVDFVGSGIIIANNTNTTGGVKMWFVGGGSVTAIGTHGTGQGSVSFVSGTAYRWTNDSGSTSSFSFTFIKTRNGL